MSLRARLRTDLVAAMKARDTDAVAALRTTIAAIDNAEAVEAGASTRGTGGEHIAGAVAGVGSTEAERRALSPDDVRAIVQEQIADRTAEADRYVSLGQTDAAGRLRREAEALRTYLSR